MIQEQISTSSQRCLDGNTGFGVVAQTVGMALNVSRDVSMLSGYSHYFPAGDVRNPVVFMHVIRRAGGMDRHIVSRVADCGNDYSGRTNRIAHHLIIEELDLPQLTCGPAMILSQQNLFQTKWNEKSRELPLGKTLPNPEITVQKCFTWELFCGDAGWGGVVAERIERGDPISLIFDPTGKNILPLIDEVFRLLPSNARWKTTFSTFFMKSQEPPRANKIQIKCIVANSDEMMYAKLTPNTLLIDLRKKITETPTGKYVDIARNGATKPSQTTSVSVPITVPNKVEELVDDNHFNHLIESVPQIENTDKENYDAVIQPITVPTQQSKNFNTQNINKKFSYNKLWLNAIPVVIFLILFLGCVSIYMFYHLIGQNKTAGGKKNTINAVKIDIKKTETERRKTEARIAAEKMEQERKESETKIAAEKIEQERKETETRIAAQKMEQERKEAEEKADAEKKQKEKKLEVNLLELPEYWRGLGFPFSGRANVMVLPNSQFLVDVKDRVKISYKPFINLELETDKAIQNIKKIEKPDGIELWYEEGKDLNGNPIKKTIATINLKENGLNFKFDDKLQGHKTDANTIRQLNRILLAKLKVEMIGIPVTKEIALYTPVSASNIDTKKFVLWGQEGKEYILSQKDRALLYFDIRKFYEIQNSKEQAQLTTPKKIVPLQESSGYVQEVTYKGEKGTCKIKPLDQKTLTLELNFFSHSLENMLNKYDELNQQIRDEISLYNELDKKKKDAEGFLFNTHAEKEYTDRLREQMIQTNPKPELIRFTEQNFGELNLANNRLNLKIKETEKKVQNYDRDISSIDNKIKKLQTEKQKLETKINESKSWNYIRLEEFSLYLLKPETTTNDADKKENQLLLLEVKP
ncbi:MAG: hypothetical protein LBK82_15630 [Planctomycetaceae bacterium]|jgi:hypothetical protein|nr:hypothetical protein [Planctomycetaceae bacterium]